ncbi:hypothetical protein G9P44_002305 [Scheffersomyces stipitis]|nr:hypothetical protein G9P44_002305 [Scheffersomyces stipitis]
MDSVSSFFENILVVDPDTAGKAKSQPEPNRRNSGLNTMDFSSLWNYGKESVATAAAVANSVSTSSNPASLTKKPSSSFLNNSYMADKLMEKIIEMIIPMDVSDARTGQMLDRIEMQKSRPPLSMAIMSNNSTELNKRMTNSFVMTDNIIRFFSWTHPFYTVGVLLIATHLILKPYLMTVLPLVLLLVRVLIPHYLIMYPPDSSYLSEYIERNPEPASYQLHKCKVPGPIPQFSREFVLNLTDLQNSQTIYISVYDFVMWLTKDYLYFKDENISSVVFLTVLVFVVTNLFVMPGLLSYLASHFYVVQGMTIVFVWGFVIAFHPFCRSRILEWLYSEDTRLTFLEMSNNVESKFVDYLESAQEPPKLNDEGYVINLDSKDIKLVEIFELQRLDNKTKMWDLVGFTNNIYTVNTATRKFNRGLYNFLAEADKHENHEHEQAASDRNSDDNDSVGLIPVISPEQKGYIKLNKKSSINDVMPPVNWKFADSKWELDLEVGEWVRQNYIEDLVMIDDDEKWVYDYDYQDGHVLDQDNEKNDVPRNVYRRRRWIRHVIRESTLEDDDQQ